MDEIKVGNKVMLNSEGPVMTVDEISRFGGKLKAVCQWFDEKHNLQKGRFDPQTLRKVEEPPE